MTRKEDLATTFGEDTDALFEGTEDAPSTISAKKTRSPRQTFLVGPTVYLRPIELTDAQLTMFWDSNPFPVPADLSEERLKESILASNAAGSRRLVACRRSDNQPVGSVELFSEDGRTTRLSFHVPVVFGPNLCSEINAEMIKLLIPMLVHEHDQMAVWADIPADDKVQTKAARTAGMKIAYTLREALHGTNGTRRDLNCWQILHPTWLAKLAKPEEAVFGNVRREVRSPAPLEYKRRQTNPPANAVVVGSRIFLRPLEQGDAEEIARWSMRETETAFDTGRAFRSPIAYWASNRKNYESSLPLWIRFAICRISDGKAIGANGLVFVDWINRVAETETEIVQPEYRGGGYGTEAKHLLLEYGFETLNLHMVRSQAWAFNTPSCAALRKQGYRDAGRLSWTGIKNGEFADDLVFDLLAEEWRAARR